MPELPTCSVAHHREVQRLGMLTDSEESGKTSADEVRYSPSSDTAASSTDADISETSEESGNVNSPETLPWTKNLESMAPDKERQEHEKVKSHIGEDLTVFSSSDISVCKPDTTAVCRATEGTKSLEPAFKREQQSRDTKEPNRLAVSSDDLGVINREFEPDETSRTKDDVQVGVMCVRSLG